MNLTWPIVYLFLYIYRCAAGIIAELYISRITTLGDNPTYIANRNFSFLHFNIYGLLDSPRRLSTEITLNLANIFSKLFFGNPILINIGFQSIAFIGILALLRELSPHQRKWMLVFLLLPSFTIWTSLAGKEAIAVFALGFLSAFLIKSTKKLNFPNFITVVSGIIIFLFKAQFLPSLLFMYGAIFAGHKIKQRAFLIFFVGLLTILAIYVQKDRIEQLSKSIEINFSRNIGFDGLAGGRSTRDVFWKEKYDVIRKSPEGMIISLMGPTPIEALKGNTILLLGFLEGLLIVAIFFILLISNLSKIPAFVFFSILFSIFWLLFATYPLGIMNPGTAIRYRTSYLPFIATIIIFFLSYYSSFDWKKNNIKK